MVKLRRGFDKVAECLLMGPAETLPKACSPGLVYLARFQHEASFTCEGLG